MTWCPDKGAVNTPNVETYLALLTALPAPYKLLAKAEWLTGMRTGEVLALGPGDVDLDGAHGPVIHVTKTMMELRSPQRFEIKGYSKNAEDRDIRVSSEFADELRAACRSGRLAGMRRAGP